MRFFGLLRFGESGSVLAATTCLFQTRTTFEWRLGNVAKGTEFSDQQRKQVLEASEKVRTFSKISEVHL